MRQTCLPAGRETNSSGLVPEYRVSLLRGSLLKWVGMRKRESLAFYGQKPKVFKISKFQE